MNYLSRLFKGGLRTHDKVSWHTEMFIDKFRDLDGAVGKALEAGMSMDEAKRVYAHRYIGRMPVHGNLALNEGLQGIINIIAGTAVCTLFDNTNAYIGVGDSSTAVVATQVGLQASTNKLYKAMDATYPIRTSQTCEWRATFSTSEANFAWNEYTVANGNSDSAVNLNRKVESKGTKVSGETWTLSVQITFS